MPSVKNPNRPSQNRMAARAQRLRKQQRQSSNAGRMGKTAHDRVIKADTKRGARPGLLPTSGPRAPLSSKKQKKLVQRMTLALKRKAELEDAAAAAVGKTTTKKATDDNVEMTDAPTA